MLDRLHLVSKEQKRYKSTEQEDSEDDLELQIPGEVEKKNSED
jgi:hypothetical protein